MSEMDIAMDENKNDEDDPRKYFTDEEWDNLSRYEKVRIQNTYEIYIEMTKSGFQMSKPEFMERNIPPQQVETPEKVLKRKNSENIEQRPKSSRIETISKSKARYPKRNVPTRNYTEQELIHDDYYIYCDICMNEYVNKCTIHETVFLPDNPVPLTPKNPNRARETVPKGWLNISSSKIVNGGEGIWALKKIKAGIRFGPYEGIREQDESDGNYTWQIKRDGKVIEYIDGQDTSLANWMRFVNCARNKSEQNLMAYQFRGKIYYRAVTDISPGTELLVFYGPQFARKLGIDTKNYNSSLETPLKDNIFECEKCQLAFSSPIYLKNHNGRCNNRKKIERKENQNKEKVDEIDYSNNNNESYKCHLCDMMYTIRRFLDYHLMVKHCVYDKKIYLKDNKENAGPSNTDLSITSNDSGYNEELKDLNKSKDRRFKCSECCKAFTARCYVERHFRIHTQEKPFKCQICNKTFTRADSLKMHKLIHSGEKPHECDICHKTFNRKSCLTRHKRIHSNIRPYQCTICNKTFTDSYVLTAHVRIHKGFKPYHCHICQYKCTQSGCLKIHIRTHSGEKPYVCKYCQQSFTRLSHLRSHERRKHNNEESK